VSNVRRANAVLKRLLPVVEAEGLRSGDTVRWVSPPWCVTLRSLPPVQRFELRMGQIKLIAEWSAGSDLEVRYWARDGWEQVLEELAA
jgi:hypothetical protein